MSQTGPENRCVFFVSHAATEHSLGGLALSGRLRRWDSGLGVGLTADSAMVGTRDIDAREQLIDDGIVTVVPVGTGMDKKLATAIDARPVYVRIDCDVLDTGTVPTDYRVDARSTACLRPNQRA